MAEYNVDEAIAIVEKALENSIKIEEYLSHGIGLKKVKPKKEVAGLVHEQTILLESLRSIIS